MIRYGSYPLGFIQNFIMPVACELGMTVIAKVPAKEKTLTKPAQEGCHEIFTS